MSDPKILPSAYIQLQDIVDAPNNPNRMPEHKYQALMRFIARSGLAQELVVHKLEDDKWEIVDGHHRAKALRELWEPTQLVPCLDATELDDIERRELSLSLNNNRGQLDLSLVSLEVDWLVEQGRELEDLEITGYTMPELEALSGATVAVSEEDLLSDAVALEEERKPPSKAPVFVLEVPMASAKELRTVKTRLRRAGGKRNKDLAKGLRILAGLDEDDR